MLSEFEVINLIYYILVDVAYGAHKPNIKVYSEIHRNILSYISPLYGERGKCENDYKETIKPHI